MMNEERINFLLEYTNTLIKAKTEGHFCTQEIDESIKELRKELGIEDDKVENVKLDKDGFKIEGGATGVDKDSYPNKTEFLVSKEKLDIKETEKNKAVWEIAQHGRYVIIDFGEGNGNIVKISVEGHEKIQTTWQQDKSPF